MDIILIEVVLIFALFKVSSIFPINAVSTIQHPERFYWGFFLSNNVSIYNF